jgi:hypothetical protein
MKSKLRGLRKITTRSLLALVAAAGLYLALLVFPDPLFAHVVSNDTIVLHADEPLPLIETQYTLRLAATKVRASPIFDSTRQHHAYLCQQTWRWRLFSNVDHHVGAMAYAPIGRAVFLRRSNVARNRLIGPSGREVPNERTLDYYLAHEVTHTMTVDFLGPRAHLELPAWVREGYADYVARGASFSYDDARQALLRGERIMQPEQSGHYLRYTLLVAHALERDSMSAQDLLRHPPDRHALEERVRRGD